LALIPVIGAGCAGTSTTATTVPTGAGTSAATTIAWGFDDQNACYKMLVSPVAAKAIGFPNAETDTLCASDTTVSKMIGGDSGKLNGSAKVVLSNLKKSSDTLYYADVTVTK